MDKHFLLTDDEGNNIAVISKKEKDSPSKLDSAIALAIKEHFIADKVKIDRKKGDFRLTATTEEDGDENIRDFTLEEIALY